VVVGEKVVRPDSRGVVRVPVEFRGEMLRIEDADGSVLARPTVPIDPDSRRMDVKIPDLQRREIGNIRSRVN
jgi:hypothetical protein